MRALEALIIVLTVGCLHDVKDKRPLDPESFARSGLGAWVEVTTNNGTFGGELISVNGTLLYVYSERTGELWYFKEATVSTVVVYPAADVNGVVGMRMFTGLAMIPHGWFLPLTLPFYLSITASSINGDIDPIARYPEQPWADLSLWARFPQGLPAGVGLPEIAEHGRLQRPPPPDAGVDAGIDAPLVDAAPVDAPAP